MKTFIVNMPVSANLCAQIEAENEEEAIKKMTQLDVRLDVVAYNQNDKEAMNAEIEEWCMFPKGTSQGNVDHSVIHEADVYEV